MKSFLSDRPRVPGPSTPPPVPAPLAGPAPSKTPTGHPAAEHARAHSTRGPSTVECVREGDRISRLIVTCPCGERIEIDCVYGGA